MVLGVKFRKCIMHYYVVGDQGGRGGKVKIYMFVRENLEYQGFRIIGVFFNVFL